MRARLVVGITTMVVGSLAHSAGPVLAVPPANDTYPGRTVIGALPFSETVDTTEATTDADDADINSTCGAPATDASVWYELTAAVDGGVAVDVSASDYTAGAIVATGGPGSWTVQACAPGTVGFTATAGQTYTILVFDDQLDGGGNGGTLELTVDAAPPPPEIDITVDPTGRFNAKTGTATVTGTVSCSADALFAFLEMELSQDVGRFTIIGFNGTEITCDGTTRPWSLEVEAINGDYKGGKAASVTFSVACGVFDCGTDFEERTIQLKGGGKH